MSIPKQASWWDHSRNTSAVFQPLPNALPDALRSLAALRRNDPALVRWIEDGHPTLTEEEHVERFGEPYQGHKRKK